MSDLVKRLRSIRGNFIIPIESPPLFQWAEEAADKIESQAAKIVQLTADVKFWRDNCEEHTAIRGQQTYDLEQLHAENKQLRDVADAAGKWHKEIGPTDGTMKAWIHLGLALNALKETAVSAIKGEGK